jgi:putative glutamine amidotransferase
VEGDGDAFLIGVQWHPEVLEMADPHTRHLFGGFIRAAMDWSTANSTSRTGVGA